MHPLVRILAWQQQKQAISAKAGGAIASTVSAAMGTAFLPVVGTVLGGLAGAVIGGGIGALIDKFSGDKSKDDDIKKNSKIMPLINIMMFWKKEMKS